MKRNLLLTAALFCTFTATSFAKDFECRDDETENVQLTILNLKLAGSSQPTLKILMNGYSNGENGEITSAKAVNFKGSAVANIERVNGESVHLITNPTDQKDGTAQWKRADGGVIEDLHCVSK